MLNRMTMMMALPLVVQAAEVPVLKQPLAAGESFHNMVEMKEVEDGRVFAGTVKEMVELDGMVAARALRAGVPVLRTQIKMDYPVQRNESVRFTFKRGGIELAGNGTSLDEGGLGETVRVLNTATRATLSGVVVGEGEVEVR